MPRNRLVTSMPSGRTTLRRERNAIASTAHQSSAAIAPVKSGNTSGAPSARWSTIVLVQRIVNAASDSVAPGLRNGGTTIVVASPSDVTMMDDGASGASDIAARWTSASSSGGDGRALSAMTYTGTSNDAA